MSYKAKTSKAAPYNASDGAEEYTSRSSYDCMTKYKEVHGQKYGPESHPSGLDLDPELVMVAERDKIHGRFSIVGGGGAFSRRPPVPLSLRSGLDRRAQVLLYVLAQLL
jgi:hypothetical protein